MQPNKLHLSAALTLSCFLTLAKAEDWYAEGFVAGIFADGENYAIGPDDNAISSVGLRGGYQLTKYFSVQAEAHTGLEGDSSYALGLGEINLRRAHYHIRWLRLRCRHHVRFNGYALFAR